MKKKLTLTVDEDLIPAAKRHAEERGRSLSSLVEEALREMLGPEHDTFAERWLGGMELAERDDERYRALLEKYG